MELEIKPFLFGKKTFIAIIIGIFTLIPIMNLVPSDAQLGTIQPPVLTPITPINDTSVQLRWIEPLDTRQILQYEIFRDDGRGAVSINIVSVGTTSYQDTGLTPGTYSYHLISQSRSEKSVPSNIESITILKPPPKPLPPKVEIESEFISKAILIKWKLPINETLNIIPYKWILERDVDGLGFIALANGERDPDNKPLEEGREVNYYLDTDIRSESLYTYRMTFVSVDGSETTVSDATVTIKVHRVEKETVYRSEGKLLETTRTIIPKIPSNPIKVIFTPIFDIQSAYADDPLVTSSLNPKDEPYLFALTPIPNPSVEADCSEILEIKYQRSSFGGQDLFIFSTIIENQTIDRNQLLHDDLTDSVKRTFQTWNIILPTEQVIQNYTNLEVQLDIDSSDDLNPLNWRQLSIYEITLIVPSGNSVC